MYCNDNMSFVYISMTGSWMKPFFMPSKAALHEYVDLDHFKSPFLFIMNKWFTLFCCLSYKTIVRDTVVYNLYRFSLLSINQYSNESHKCAIKC